MTNHLKEVCIYGSIIFLCSVYVIYKRKATEKIGELLTINIGGRVLTYLLHKEGRKTMCHGKYGAYQMPDPYLQKYMKTIYSLMCLI